MSDYAVWIMNQQRQALEDRDDRIDAIERQLAELEDEKDKYIADLEQQLADTKMRLLAYEKHYGVITGAAVSLILAGTLPFKDSPQEQDKEQDDG